MKDKKDLKDLTLELLEDNKEYKTKIIDLEYELDYVKRLLDFVLSKLNINNEAKLITIRNLLNNLHEDTNKDLETIKELLGV